jgi:hypothetical protein
MQHQKHYATLLRKSMRMHQENLLFCTVGRRPTVSGRLRSLTRWFRRVAANLIIHKVFPLYFDFQNKSQGKSMPFINEFIPSEDVENYDLKAIDERVFVGRTRARDWTVDRDRNIYLRNIAHGGGPEIELSNRMEWTFFWKGTPLTLRIDLLEGRGGQKEHGWSHWKLIWLNGSHGLPEQLKSKKDEILETLKEALTAYKGAGIYSADYADYSVTLAVAEDCVL